MVVVVVVFHGSACMFSVSACACAAYARCISVQNVASIVPLYVVHCKPVFIFTTALDVYLCISYALGRSIDSCVRLCGFDCFYEQLNLYFELKPCAYMLFMYRN